MTEEIDMTQKGFDEEGKKKQIILYAKVFQGFFLALFFLGVSIAVGDLAEMLQIPVSSFSMASMTYGILGMLGCEYIARQFSS